jgi:hypothetical protein
MASMGVGGLAARLALAKRARRSSTVSNRVPNRQVVSPQIE